MWMKMAENNQNEDQERGRGAETNKPQSCVEANVRETYSGCWKIHLLS